MILTRDQWEEPGYRIVEHTNSPPVNPLELTYTVNHYPAASSIVGDPVSWVRGVQRSYVDSRGYSVGYSWAYWPDGLEIEMRGWEFRNAANDAPDRPEDENRVSVALLLIVPGLGDAGAPATPAQITAVRARLENVHIRAGRNLPNIVHGDLEPTGCAGAGVNHQTHTGQFLPVPTNPYPPTEEDEMSILVTVGTSPTDFASFVQTPAGVLRWIVTGNELEAWKDTVDAEALMTPDLFGRTVDAGRTIGSISADVTRITGVSADRWAGRLIA